MTITVDDAKIFRSRVSVGPKAECWEWLGTPHGDGYGKFYVPTLKRVVLAHRVAYAIHAGRLPNRAECVCHQCDNPGCVNPSHLFLGTQRENIADMVRKGRNYVQPKLPRVPRKMLNGLKTHCPQGHAYDEANTRVSHGRGSRMRMCRACDAARSREIRRRARG